MRLKKLPSGNYTAVMTDETGNTKQVNTKQRSLREAKRVVSISKLEELESLARNGILSKAAYDKLIFGRRISGRTAVEEWQDWLRVNHAEETMLSYGNTVNLFLERTGMSGQPVDHVTEIMVHDFINREGKAKLASRRIWLAALRSFFVFCAGKHYCNLNPAALAQVNYDKLTHAQKEPKVRMPVTPDEYRQLMATAKGFWRDAIALSYWTGLRLGDVAMLEWDCFTTYNEIAVWTGKRNRRVALPLDNPLIGGGELFSVLSTLDYKDERYVFPRYAAMQSYPKYSRQLPIKYNYIFRRAGVAGKSFHCLRHSFITRLANAGVTLEEIGRLVGHANTSTTEGYRHKNNEEVSLDESRESLYDAYRHAD